MAMSVAENAPVTTEPTPRGLQQQLAVGSLLGALFVLLGLWVTLAGLPLVWANVLHVPEYVNEFLSATLLMMLCGVAAVVIGYAGYLLIRSQHQPGLRAGIFFAAVMLFVALWVGEGIASLSEARGETIGLTIGGIVTLALLGGAVFLFLQPGWGRILETVEDQGWFHGNSFKANQGVRVRRGTVVGVLTLGICGIVTLVLHRSFGFETPDLANDWLWIVPGTAGEYAVPLIYRVHVLMPLLLGIALVYFAWRVVNVPAFADFLIATEAEMNKVSWTTRRRLIQDTIVVLVTVVLMTLFLFLVDIMWIQILSNPYVGVLQYNPRDQQKQQQEKNQW